MSTSKPFVSPSFTYETMEEMLDVKPKGAELFIGIPKETSFQENRIPLIPESVSLLHANGHEIVIEAGAGKASNIEDSDYSEAGARIVYSPVDVYKADIVLKVAPPSPAFTRNAPSTLPTLKTPRPE